MYKVIKTIAVCVIIVGFVWIYGTVGADDHATFSRVYVPFSETVKGMITGAGIAFAGWLVYRITNRMSKRRNAGKER